MALEQESNRQLIQQRLNLFRIPVLLIFLVLGARLWQLQIIQGSEYALKAERNRIRSITLTAPRGNILDRNGVPLVDNRPSFDVLVYREDMRDREATVRFLTRKLGIDPEEIEKQFERHRGTGLYRPFIVKENAGMEDISIIEAHRGDHPEIKVGPEPRRQYRYGPLAAHLLGYLGEISEEELKSDRFPGAVAGQLVGRSGVERFYNRLLAGKDGVRRVLVDSLGREVEILDESEPLIGGELRLTLDLRLQLVAEEALRDKVGVVAAMDPRNGEILALASSPAFDPNAFSRRISGSDWEELVRHPDHPMQNRAIQNSHSPGSIFKLIMAGAGFRAGVLEGDPVIVCRGGARYYGRVFHCWDRGGHGALRLEQAIAKSCNIFFYELGRDLGIERISEFARELGLGSPSGIDLPGERGGIMPSPEWKREVRGEPWYPGETISVSIGQGAVSTTPVQLLRAVGALVTAGRLVTPHLLLHAEGGDEGPQGGWEVKRLPIEEAHARRIRQGMWESVNAWGTGHNAEVPGEDICGKTGTAQVVGKEAAKRLGEGVDDHAWFAGFGRRDDPEIAVVVFIEHGGSGGGAAAPVAREIFRTYFQSRRSPGAEGHD